MKRYSGAAIFPEVETSGCIPLPLCGINRPERTMEYRQRFQPLGKWQHRCIFFIFMNVSDNVSLFERQLNFVHFDRFFEAFDMDVAHVAGFDKALDLLIRVIADHDFSRRGGGFEPLRQIDFAP